MSDNTRIVTKTKGKDVSSKKSGPGGNDDDVNIMSNESKNPDGSKKKTDDLIKKLNKINASIDKEKEQEIQELEELNSQLQDKLNSIEQLSTANQLLFKELNEIKNTVDEKMKFIRIFKFKENQLENQIKDIEKDIKLKNKQYENSEKMINKVYKKEKESLENLLQKNGPETQNELYQKLHELTENVKENEEEIAEIKKETKNHKECGKNIQNLNLRVKILKNDLEYEKKKSNQIRDTNDYSYQEEVSYDDKLKRKRFLGKRGKSYSSRPNKRMAIPNHKDFQNAKEMQRKRELSIKISPIWKEFDEIRKEKIKKSKNQSITDIFKGSYNNSLPTELFTEEEYEILSKKLEIPETFLQEISLKFQAVEDEKNKIEGDIYENKKLESELKNTEQNIDYSSLKMKELNEKNIKLKVESSKQKQVIKELKKDVKEWETKLKEINYFFTLKNKQNITLKRKLNELNQQIENGELILLEKYKPVEEEPNEEEDNGEDEDNNNDDQNDEDED